MRENLRGILLMIIAMGLFAVEDTLVKLASGGLPTGQILFMLGFAGAPIFAIWGASKGASALTRAALHPALLWRNALEMIGTFGFVTALTLIPLSLASAILQAAPIIVTAGAALILGEAVGWRRWAAVILGFVGVLIILRPGAAGFDPNSLWAVLGVVGLAGRDLATRKMPAGLPTTTVATWGFASVGALGVLEMTTGGGAVWPDGRGLGLVAAAMGIGLVAYWCIIEATRAGDASAVAPFRYSRIVAALILGALVFDERPDIWMLVGAAIVVCSGLYTYLREGRLKRLSNPNAPR